MTLSEQVRQAARDRATPSIGWSFRSYVGLGDQLYMRPFVLDSIRQGNRTYIYTPWPELFWDVPQLRLIPEDQGYRTQRANVIRQDPRQWSIPPAKSRMVVLNYEQEARARGGSLLDCFARTWPIKDIAFELHLAPQWEAKADQLIASLPLDGRDLCLVYLPTLRQEWLVPSRNPHPEYLQMLIDRGRDRFFYLAISWADPPREVLAGDWGPFDAAYLAGDLHFTTIAALMRSAAVVLCPPNFFLPLGTSVRANVFCLFGGFAPPNFVLDDRMGLSRTRHIAPESPCACFNGDHDCMKDIPRDRLLATYDQFLAEFVDRK